MYFIPYNLKKTTNLLYTQHLDTKLLNFLQSHAWSHHATHVVCVSSLFIFEVYQTNVCCFLIEQVKAHVFFFFFFFDRGSRGWLIAAAIAGAIVGALHNGTHLVMATVIATCAGLAMIGYLLLVQRYPAKAFETGKASA